MSSELRFSHICFKKRIINFNMCLAGLVFILILSSSDGSASFSMECGDTNYLGNSADYILEGKVEKLESKLVEDEYGFNGRSVYTFNTLKIEKYIKGNPLSENTVQIVTFGGTAEGMNQSSANEPNFIEGTWVRVYLREKNGSFSLVCALMGVEELLPPYMTAPAPAEIWKRTFHGVGSDKAYFVEQTPDGGFILSGETGMSESEEMHVMLIKTDSNGKEIWNKTFGKKTGQTARSVFQASDGGYLFISNNMLTKVDENGKYLWGREFSGIGDSIINSMSQTKDSINILVGDNVLIKADEKGNVLWKKAFEKLKNSWINSIQQTNDDGYIFSGTKIKDGEEDAWFFKIDSAGNEQWNRTFGGNTSDYAYHVQETEDGGYVITGETSSYGKGDFDAWLIKTDDKGIEKWNKTFGGTFRDSAYFVKQTPDRGFVLAGSRSYRDFEHEGWLINADESGSLKWMKTFRESGISSVYSVIPTQDGGFVVAGYTSSYWGNNPEACLIKLGGKTNETINIVIDKMNGTSAAIPAMSFTPIPSTIENASVEKATGFEKVPATIALLAVYGFVQRKSVKTMRLRRR